jgi:hypothetical protein
MENSKIKKMILMIALILLISFIYTMVDTYPWKISTYNIGRYTGIMFKHLIKVLGLIVLIVLFIKNYKK